MEQQALAANQGVIAFLTDFGLSDGYVGVMKGVALSIAPQARVLDITHDISPQDIEAGAWVLATSYRYFPEGTIFACVVDPGVGSARRPVAVHAGKWYFVGPDNGLLSYVIAEQPVHEAVALANAAYRLAQVSHTFHGRDIFAPAAAHLARGVSIGELGQAVDPAELQVFSIAAPALQEGRIQARVVHIDHFGNIVTNIPLDLIPDLFERSAARLLFPEKGLVINERQRFFASSAGEKRPFLFGDSSGHIAVAIGNGNAARTLDIARGALVTLVLV